MNASYQAPFAPGGTHAVDSETARRLLDLALARGGSYAELYFQYAVTGTYALEQGFLKIAARSACVGSVTFKRVKAAWDASQ